MKAIFSPNVFTTKFNGLRVRPIPRRVYRGRVAFSWSNRFFWSETRDLTRSRGFLNDHCYFGSDEFDW